MRRGGRSVGPMSSAVARPPSEVERNRVIDLDHGLPQGEQKAASVRRLFDTISPRYDMVNRLMTFRLDVRWRRLTVDALGLPRRSTVLDLAAGTGDFCRELESRGMRPVGMDFSFGMLHHARTSAPLAQADALRLPVSDAAFDGVTCGFALRNFVDLAAFFREVSRVVRPGGRVALLDACAPERPLLRFGHGVYFGRVVPRIGGLFGDKSAYAYLPKSLAYLPPADEMLDSLRSAGLSGVQRRLLFGGAAQLIVGTRTGDPGTAR